MKEISAELVTGTVRDLFLEANRCIGRDIEEAITAAAEKEALPAAVNVLKQIAASYRIAREEKLAICQDTGLAVLFVELGQEVRLGGDFTRAVNEGVRQAYTQGYFRASVVEEPLFERLNTRDNTPAVIHLELVPGDHLTLTAMPKGFGAENCSRTKVFPPASTIDDIRDYVVDTVRAAGPNVCPPSFVGVGIGGTLEVAVLLAKKTFLRPLGRRHPDPRYAELEEQWLEAVNRLGLGPGGLGGATTALAVNINTGPTHIAAVPVAVNFCCHASRHARRTL